MSQLHVFKRLFHYVSRYKLRLLWIMLLGLVGVVFEVAKPLSQRDPDRTIYAGCKTIR